jgi:hypothetical protein
MAVDFTKVCGIRNDCTKNGNNYIKEWLITWKLKLTVNDERMVVTVVRLAMYTCFGTFPRIWHRAMR